MSSCASHCMLPGPPPRDHADEAHALLDQPPRQQAAPAVVVGRLLADAVQLERLRRFLGEVEHRRRFGLHLEGQVVGVDARRELLVARLAGSLRSDPRISPSVLRALFAG